MRRLTIILLAVMLIVLCSCELAVKAPEPGRMHIFVYGNDYKYGKAVYYEDGKQAGSAPALNGTVNDAYQVCLALCSLAAKAGYEYEGIFMTGTESRGVSDPNISVIKSVYKSDFISVLDTLAKKVESSDITIIYYSGHGMGGDEKLEYGSDTSKTSYMALRRDVDFSSSILYPLNEFLAKVETIPGTKVILGDFCHSGGMVRAGNVSITAGEYDGIDATTLLTEYRNDICESSSVFCLSAARYYERSHEPGGGLHGYFTRALLEGLGWDEESQSLTKAEAMVNNRITLFNLAKYTTDNDNEKPGDPQTPMTSGGSNDIILFSF